MQKIAILSDIHGNIAALEKVVTDIQTRQVDRVFNLGDHVSGPLWPEETILYLMKQDWIHIRGNNDRQLVDQALDQHGPSNAYAFQRLNQVELDWLRSLPASLEVEDEFLLIHGTPSSDTSYLLETVERGQVRLATPSEITARLGETKFHIILCGHTHYPRVVVAGDKMLINPGSVGLPAYRGEFPEQHVIETGSPHARYAILEQVNQDWQAELIAIPYDYRTAGAQALKNGRPDWEVGLLTGYMEKRA